MTTLYRTQRNPWIFDSFLNDFSIFILPTLFSILYFSFFRNSPEDAIHRVIVSTVMLILADNGHVYLTLWRTYLDKNERRRSAVYWSAPIILFTFIFLMTQWNIQYFWTFIIYATVYHNLRQLYGFSRWYQKLNQHSDPRRDYFLYALCLLPLVIITFGEPRLVSFYYSVNDALYWPNTFVYETLLNLYVMTIIAWLLYELKCYRKGRWHANHFLFLCICFSMYGFSFFNFKNSFELIGPLAFAHGVAYYATMNLSVKKMKTFSFNVTIPILLSGFILGFGEYFFSEFFVDYSGGISGTQSLIISLWITPLLCHYYFDSFLWTGRHPDFQTITT